MKWKNGSSHWLKSSHRSLVSSPAAPHGWGCAPDAEHDRRTWWWPAEPWSSAGPPGSPPIGTASMAWPCLSPVGGVHDWQGEAQRKASARGGAAVDNLPDPLLPPLVATSRPAAPHAGHHSILLLPPQPAPARELPPPPPPPCIPSKSCSYLSSWMRD
jgi:hypothetical protein